MSETGLSYEQTIKKTHTRLKSNALNFWEVSAQAVALISPSMTAALIVPLMFGTAGTAGWLCYLFGTIMLLFVAINLNQFASDTPPPAACTNTRSKAWGRKRAAFRAGA